MVAIGELALKQSGEQTLKEQMTGSGERVRENLQEYNEFLQGLANRLISNVQT